jgi:plasmid replication initiation protein
LDESYGRMDNFKESVLDPAIKDINTHSNYQVFWTQRKTGRNVTHLTFIFFEKKPKNPKPILAIKEKMIGGVKESGNWQRSGNRGKARQRGLIPKNKLPNLDEIIV